MIKFKVQTNKIFPSTRRKAQQLQKLPQDAHKVWVQNTPVDTGNARRKTQLSGNTINANYPYARPLNKGWSKQSPQGMQKPTENYLRRRIKNILGAK
jgi:hypothetical protein